MYACIKTHVRAAELFAGWPREGRVLEVAAGSGAFARRLLELGFRVEACDLYPDQFRVPEVPVRYADLSERLPYDDASFEYLSCLEGVEHLEDQFAFVRECWRVLKPGGRLLLSTPNILGLASRWRYFWTGFFFPKGTPDAIVQQLDQASNRTLNAAITIERLRKTGIEPIAADRRSPAYLQTFLQAEMRSWADQVKASGLALQ